MANRRLAKDIQHLCRHVHSVSDGQVRVAEVDDNLEYLILDVIAKDGLYKGANLRFKLLFSTSYPDEVPEVVCLTRVYHPNIDPEYDESTHNLSNICISLLDDWTPAMTLDHIVIAVLFLLYNPALDDALSPYFDCCMDIEEFVRNVKQSLHGGDIDGFHFPCLYEDDWKGSTMVTTDTLGQSVREDCLDDSSYFSKSWKETNDSQPRDIECHFDGKITVNKFICSNSMNTFLNFNTLNSSDDITGSDFVISTTSHGCQSVGSINAGHLTNISDNQLNTVTKGQTSPTSSKNQNIAITDNGERCRKIKC